MRLTAEEAIVLEKLRSHCVGHLDTKAEWDEFERLTGLDRERIRDAVVSLGRKGLLRHPTFTWKIKNRPSPFPQSIRLVIQKEGEQHRKRFPTWLRKELYERAGWRCQIQNCEFCQNRNLSGVKWGLSIDHVIPVDYGKLHGAAIEHSAQNLRVVCFRWNCWARSKVLREKYAHAPIPPALMTDEEFLALLGRHSPSNS